MNALHNIRTIVGVIEYKDWWFRVSDDPQDLWLQVCFNAPDTITGEIALQTCRKWRLSEWMTDTEIVDAAYLAIERAEIHEIKEHFKFDGVLVFNPHLDIWDRRDLAAKNKVDVRS